MMVDQPVSNDSTTSSSTANTSVAGSDSGQYKKPNINPPAPLNTSARDAAEEWKMWKQMWDN